MSDTPTTPKFQIGDFVVLATDFAGLLTVRRLRGAVPNPILPLQVSERRVQECHGGVNQVHYVVVGHSGLYPELGLVPYSDYEDELVLQAELRAADRTVERQAIANLQRQMDGLAGVVDAITRCLPDTPEANEKDESDAPG